MKKTPFNELHKALGGKMIEFCGWEMPVEYAGIIPEHMAVRTQAGLFDVSHMGEVLVTGKDALAFVQWLTPNDASKLVPGQVQYTALMTPESTFVDDILVYCMGPEEYFLVVNAANDDKDFAWIAGHARGFDVEVEHQSDAYSQLALQGPLAETVLQPLADIDLAALKTFNWARGRVLGKEALVSRTGYTGEDGFEIYTRDPDPGGIWKALIETGKPLGLQPIGLGARDTLRLEAKLMLYGNDISDKTTVLEADLKWIVKLQKGDFLGKPAIEKQLAEGLTRKLVGFEMAGPGIARPHYPVFVGGERFGEVASGTFSPLLKRAIGLVYLPIEATTAGAEFEIEIRGKRAAARVVPTPFYKRAKR
ncbi:MAG TPA: glycine cleavage system aminomethyltransferase GcvT [Candidatus Aminicenantes bacterium]|nr:glycine cleavage system aminomethyltransferase GcvT [Candidatus Aminicenantes bacterium]